MLDAHFDVLELSTASNTKRQQLIPQTVTLGHLRTGIEQRPQGNATWRKRPHSVFREDVRLVGTDNVVGALGGHRVSSGITPLRDRLFVQRAAIWSRNNVTRWNAQSLFKP